MCPVDMRTALLTYKKTDTYQLDNLSRLDGKTRRIPEKIRRRSTEILEKPSGKLPEISEKARFNNQILATYTLT